MSKQNGKIVIEIDGANYTLALTLDSMVAVEEMFSTPQREMTFEEVSGRAERGHMKYLRGYLWALMQEHHKDIKVGDISGLVTRAGGLAAITLAIMEVAKESMPDQRDLAELDVKDTPTNPRKAQAKKTDGTGASSGFKDAAQA